MAAAIPICTPAELGAGRSATWKITLCDYPAGNGYSLRYVLHDGSNKISFTSAASGDDHLVTITPSDSSSWAAGTYSYQAYAEKTDESWMVEEGTLTVLADFGSETTYDARSVTKKQLDALNDAITSLASGTLQSYTTTSGTYTKKNLKELIDVRDRLLVAYRSELGKNKGRQIKARFGPRITSFAQLS